MSGPISLRAAGHALMYWQMRQDVNANNLANTETTAFRAQRVFAETMPGGVPRLGTVTDPTAGELRQTGSPLDLALVGEGSFVVQTPDGFQTVRSGSFSLDADGRIVDAQGHPLLGMNGPLLLPPGPVEIDARGGITVAGERVGRLRVVRGGEEAVSRAGPGVARGPGTLDVSELQDLEEHDIRVRQGYIETSNVSALDALVEMTTIQRSFEAVQNSVRAIDSMMDTVANRIGRVE